MKKYVIDGLFLTQQITGIQRYAYEIVTELDKLVTDFDVEILIPENASIDLHLKNISIIRYGKRNGIIWQETDYAHYLKVSKSYALCLTNTLPIFYKKGIIAIHDVSYKANPQFFNSKRDKLSALWHRLNYYIAAHSKMNIVTVSEFSKSEIVKYYKVKPERITVIHNAWQHMKKINISKTTFDKFTQIFPRNYYFAMCTLAPNKNLNWIVNAAKANPDEIFAVAGGGKLKNVAETEYRDLKNLFFLGYVTDEDAKTLLANCKGFLFPTLYEGFGIPPLEAIACGAENVLVSDTPCMHEIYGKSVGYIDLASTDYSIVKSDVLMNPQSVLNKYSWKASAEKLYDLL